MEWTKLQGVNTPAPAMVARCLVPFLASCGRAPVGTRGNCTELPFESPTLMPENPPTMSELFNTLADFFNALTNEQKIFLGILSLLVFALGVIVGWILQGTKTRRYKKELLVLRKDRDEYEVRYRTIDQQHKALAKELEAMSREKTDAFDQIQGLRGELQQRENELTPLRSRIEELESSNQSFAATIESLNDQVIGLKTQNEQLMENAQGGSVNPGAGAGSGQVGSAGFGGSPAAEDGAFAAYLAANERRFQLLEERLMNLGNAPGYPASGGGQPAPQPPFGDRYQPVIPPPVETDANGEPLVIRADTTEPGVRTGSHGEPEVIVQTTPSIQVPPIAGAPLDDSYDDLTRIHNIGPFLQAKLHENDITRYEQIANWTEADIMTYTELIGYLPGVIQRDDWVGQANSLARGEVQEPQPYVADDAPAAAGKGDNLRIIEGIGPKIAGLLNDAGITTYEQLAGTDADRLREILAAAGSRYKAHNPQSWPAQAGLAADGKLDELRAWQRELKGGADGN